MNQKDTTSQLTLSRKLVLPVLVILIGLAWLVMGYERTENIKPERKIYNVLPKLVSANAGRQINAPKVQKEEPEIEALPLSEEEKNWGIEITSVRLTSAGYMIDFRYKVRDPLKAAPLLKRTAKSYLMHEATGRKFLVPSSPKVGSLRQTTSEPATGRVYYTFFANPGKFIKSGDKVSVVIGEFAVKGLTIE